MLSRIHREFLGYEVRLPDEPRFRAPLGHLAELGQVSWEMRPGSAPPQLAVTLPSR